ncbi:Mitochondrial substrate/solute carrier [Sesbania bispinosa]|nr:Mitochondrial substrate/solute carrier [Sesbania bispinosa]
MSVSVAEEESGQEVHVPAEIDWQMLDKSKFFFLGAALFSGVSATLGEGFRALYLGFGTSLMGTIPARALYMAALEMTKSNVGTATVRFGLAEPTAAAIPSAAMADWQLNLCGLQLMLKIMNTDGLRGLWEAHHFKLSAAMAAQLVWTPIDVVSQRLMVQGYCNSSNPKASDFRYINGIDAFRKIMNTEKWEEHH